MSGWFCFLSVDADHGNLAVILKEAHPLQGVQEGLEDVVEVPPAVIRRCDKDRHFQRLFAQ